MPPLAHAGLHAAVFNVVGSSAHSGSAATLADGLDDPKVCFRACNPGARVTARGRNATVKDRYAAPGHNLPPRSAP